MKIGDRPIGRLARPFIIAEMSGNHNQSLDRALAIVDAAAHDGHARSARMKLRLYHHTDGARVAYREQGTGPALILWHSELLSHRELTPLVEGLEHRHRVVLPDLPLRDAALDRLVHVLDGILDGDDVARRVRVDLPDQGGHTAMPVFGVKPPSIQKFNEFATRDIVLLASEATADGEDGRCNGAGL